MSFTPGIEGLQAHLGRPLSCNTPFVSSALEKGLQTDRSNGEKSLADHPRQTLLGTPPSL